MPLPSHCLVTTLLRKFEGIHPDIVIFADPMKYLTVEPNNHALDDAFRKVHQNQKTNTGAANAYYLFFQPIWFWLYANDIFRKFFIEQFIKPLPF